MNLDEELFGTEEQNALMRRGARLWRLLRDNPRFTYYGRLVALSEHGPDTPDILFALAGLQGAGTGYFVEKQRVADLFRAAEERGLTPDRHEHFRGGEEALEASRAALGQHALPADLSVRVLDRETPGALVKAVAELWNSCEVMPVPGAVMRGLTIPGTCLAAIDGDGEVVAAAASYMLHHPRSTRAKDAFWGMLATRPDRRGEKISLILGAQAILHMWKTHGARGFMTGVRADNEASKALCNRLGVRDTPWAYCNIIDPEMMPGGKVTK
jgi:hypothetical protein